MNSITKEQLVVAFKNKSATTSPYKSAQRQARTRFSEPLRFGDGAPNPSALTFGSSERPRPKWRTIINLAQQLNVSEEQIRHVLETNTREFERAFVGGTPVYRLAENSSSAEVETRP